MQTCSGHEWKKQRVQQEHHMYSWEMFYFDYLGDLMHGVLWNSQSAKRTHSWTQTPQSQNQEVIQTIWGELQ